MIIRRGRRPVRFTLIGNDLFEDERLAADEVGILAFLLSRPNDWEVRRPALMRRFKIGRESIRRIVANWIRTGWCAAEKIRIKDGTFVITYAIRDEPGPELTEEEVRRALSLVSNEATADETSDSPAPDADPDPEPCAPPGITQPVLAAHPLESRNWPIRGSLNTDPIKTDSTQALWSNVEKTWPDGHLLSSALCEKLFASLTIEDRQAAFRGIAAYLSDCRTKNRKVCDLSTYLRERRWHGRAAIHVVKAWATMGGTPQAYRWLDYRKSLGLPTSYLEDLWKMGKPWYAETEWPPALPPKEPPAQAAPNSLSTEDDLNSLAQG